MERMLEVQIFSDLSIVDPSLDLGCGDGVFSKIAFGGEITCGLDSNPKELKLASERTLYRTTVLANAAHIPFSDRHFRTIISNSVMEHMDNLEQILKECHRVLRESGNMYITVPTKEFERYTFSIRVLEALKLFKLSKIFRRTYNWFWSHKNVYDIPQWELLFKSAGFEVMDSFRYNSKRQTFVNDLLAWTGLFSWLLKICFNRWTLFQSPRKFIASALLYRIFRSQITLEKTKDGSLVYFYLRKSS